jgi:hypothetical protein
MIYCKRGEHANQYTTDAVLRDKEIGFSFLYSRVQSKSGCLIIVQDELNTQ